MPLISLCMIVRNEEAVLGRCLDSVADLVDEIILVDTGSTDNTKAVAAEYAAKIYDFPWCDDFSAARNYAVSQAVGDYWLWLDADDVIEGENHEKLRKSWRLRKQTWYFSLTGSALTLPERPR